MDLNTLMELASNATPGPWTDEEGDIVNRDSVGDDWDIGQVYAQNNRAYIAALSPDVVLRLLACVRAADAMRGAYKSLAYDRTLATDDPADKYCDPYDAARAALSKEGA